MSGSPLFTIYVEVHDLETAAALIGVACDQTVSSLEIRLVDRSEAGLAPAELEGLVQLDPRVVERPVARAASAWNLWLPSPGAQGAGTYWAVLRRDCLWFPDHLEAILPGLRAGVPVVAWWINIDARWEVDVLGPIAQLRRTRRPFMDRMPQVPISCLGLVGDVADSLAEDGHPGPDLQIGPPRPTVLHFPAATWAELSEERIRLEVLALRARLPPHMPRAWLQSRIQPSLLEAALNRESPCAG